jgi:hypothetical protein
MHISIVRIDCAIHFVMDVGAIGQLLFQHRYGISVLHGFASIGV